MNDDARNHEREDWTDGLEGHKERKKHVTLCDTKHLQIFGGGNLMEKVEH
jgi:hypothetical protein